jgi:hypothetical protein
MTTPRERAERALRHAPFMSLGKEAVLPLVEQEIAEAVEQERERCVRTLREVCYVGLATGRSYLRLGEYVTIVEGDPCRATQFYGGAWDKFTLDQVCEDFIASFGVALGNQEVGD